MNARMAWVTKAALLALVALCAVSVPVVARTYKGTAKANKVSGTKKADKIRLGGGNDRARGRAGNDRIAGGAGKDVLAGDAGKDRVSGDKGNDSVGGGKGNDRLNGGAGNDRVVGGKGKDHLAGASGNDILNSVDGKKDASINAGKGRNTCRIDRVELKIAKGCTKILIGKAGAAAPGGGVPGGGPGGGGPGGPGGPAGPAGPDGPLALRSGEGLSCNSSLPTCHFSLEGTGAEQVAGTVTGEEGAQPAAGASVSVQEDGEWLAEGIYGCTGDGSLRVDIGTETVLVPVTCNQS